MPVTQIVMVIILNSLMEIYWVGKRLHDSFPGLITVRHIASIWPCQTALRAEGRAIPQQICQDCRNNLLVLPGLQQQDQQSFSSFIKFINALCRRKHYQVGVQQGSNRCLAPNSACSHCSPTLLPGMSQQHNDCILCKKNQFFPPALCLMQRMRRSTGHFSFSQN